MKKLIHFLDYNILKEWGFMWFTYNDRNEVTIYATQRTQHTDLFSFCPLMLAIYPHPNLGWIWDISVVGYKDNKGYTLFRGRILNNIHLRVILSSVYPIKPTARDIRKANQEAKEFLKEERDARQTKNNTD